MGMQLSLRGATKHGDNLMRAPGMNPRQESTNCERYLSYPAFPAYVPRMQGVG